MAVDPFNSVGGYTVGIPPMPIISASGDITSPSGSFTNINVSGDAAISGNVTADLFRGSFDGQISGNVTVTGNDTEVLINKSGVVGSDPGITFNYTEQKLNVTGDFAANSITLGSGQNEFSTSSVMFAVTNTTTIGQVLHTQPATNICSVDYTIIATDPVANIRQTSKLFASVLGDEVGYFEYGTIDVPQTSSGVADFKVENVSGNVALTVKPMSTNNTTYKIMITSYKE